MSRRIVIGAVALALGTAPGTYAQDPEDHSTHWIPHSGTSGGDVFGEIVDVAQDAEGRVYVADAGRNVIHVLDRRLRVQGSLGRRGSAAGAYRQLQAVRTLGRDRVAALDRELSRISFYRWVNGRPRLYRTVSLPFQPYDFCPTPGGFAVLGYHDGKRIHEIDTLGTIRASAAPYEVDLGAKVIRFIIKGRLACLDTKASRTYILTSSSLPTFEIWGGPKVAELSRSRVDSISPVRRITIETDGRSATFTGTWEGYHSPGRAFRTPQGFAIAAQVRSRTDRTFDDSVRVFGFSLGSDGVKHRMRTLGHVYPLADGSFLSILRAPHRLRIITSLENSVARAPAR